MSQTLELNPTYEQRKILAETCEQNRLWFQAHIHWREAAKKCHGELHWTCVRRSQHCLNQVPNDCQLVAQ